MADSRLADIYRKELKTKGLLGALVSASGARLKEKTDIRGMLPQTGVSGAAFEKMFGKRYKYGGDKQGIRSSGNSNSVATKSMEEKLTRIGVDGKLTAKNTVVLPAMARDMNLMRMNMQKMVKLSGGTPSTKSDMFFKRASDRESQYESQYKRNSGGLAPTPVAGKKEGGGFLGMLGSLLGGAKDIVSAFGGFFKGLFGVILASGIIGQFLKDPETRANFLDFITKFLKGFFDGVKATFEVVGEALQNKDVQESIAGAIRAIFNAILEVFKVELTKIETPFGNLSVTIGDVLLAFVGFKAAMFALETAILLRAANIGRGGGMGLPGGPGGPGGPDGPDKGKGKGRFLDKFKNIGSKVGKVGLYGMGAYGAYEGYNAVFGDDNAEPTGADAVPEDSVSKKNLGLNTDTALAVGGTTLATAGVVYSGSKIKEALTPTKISTPEAKPGFLMSATDKIQARAATEVKTSSRWGRFLAFVAKKSPALSARLGVKLAAMAGMAAIPVAGWISALFQLGFAIGDIYAIYSLWCEFTGTDEEKANPEVNDAATNATPVAADPTPPAAPMTPAAAPKMAPGGNAKRGGSTSPTPSGDGAIPSNGPIDPSKTTFADLTVEQQNSFMSKQREMEGFKPGSLTYDLNNPGAMLFGPTAEKYGGVLDTTGRGVGTVKGKFASFPTLAAGTEAHRALLLSRGYRNLSLDQAINRWVTGNKDSDIDANMSPTGQKITNYKSGIYAAIGGAPTTTLASATPSTPSSGSSLTRAQSTLSTLAMNTSSAGQTIVNAPVTNTLASSSGGGGGNGNMNPYNGDLMKYLLRPVT